MSGFEFNDLRIVLGLLTLMGSVISCFFQRRSEKHNEVVANHQKEIELDRQQALERVRWQLGSIVGPMHRLYKTQNTVVLNFIQQEDKQLVMDHMIQAIRGDNEEWLAKYDQQRVTSPIVGSPNTNVILDTFVAWTLEFDDILESWVLDRDFARMQPTTVVAWAVCNELVDTLYENAKTKEARYNKHVTVHKNIVDADLANQLHRSLKTYRDHAPDAIETV